MKFLRKSNKKHPFCDNRVKFCYNKNESKIITFICPFFNSCYHYGMNKVGGINIEFLSVVSIHSIHRPGKFIATPIPFLAVKQSSNNHFYIYSRHILHVYHKKYCWWLVFLEIELGMKVIKDDYIIFKIWDYSFNETMLRRNYMTRQNIKSFSVLYEWFLGSALLQCPHFEFYFYFAWFGHKPRVRV